VLESECAKGIFSPDTKLIACCRLGGKDETIKYGKVSELASNKNLEKVQALLVIPGELHFKEEEALEMWK
jgi:diphthamide biosynthesis methyltransferase